MKLELVQTHGKRAVYRLLEPVTFMGITAPEGMLTDFASVPTALEWVVSGEDNHIVLPSIIHDWLYQCRGDIGDGTIRTRKQADELLRGGMKQLGAPWWKRNAVYLAVRVGGGAAWRDDE